jgi:hypothetical protein
LNEGIFNASGTKLAEPPRRPPAAHTHTDPMEIVELEMCDVRSTTGSDLSSDAGCSSSGMTRSDSVVFDDGTQVPREVAELGLHGEINLFELSMEGQLQALAQAHARIAAEKRLQQDWFLTPVLGKSLSWVRNHPHRPCPTRIAPSQTPVARRANIFHPEHRITCGASSQVRHTLKDAKSTYQKIAAAGGGGARGRGNTFSALRPAATRQTPSRLEV